MKKQSAGFTLLEVMVAVAILALSLTAIFSSEAGAVKMAHRSRKMGLASLLVRCKMGEIEEQIAKEGFPALFDEGEDECCADAEIEGFTCKWEIQPVTMPDEMFESEDEEGEGGESGDDTKGELADEKLDSKSLEDAKEAADGADAKKDKLDATDLMKDPKKLLGGGSTTGLGGLGLGLGGEDEAAGGSEMDAIASMAMQYVYPILKPSFESQIRRATVTVMWTEGTADKSFDVTQYLVAEQPIMLPDGSDPNAQNTGTDSTGTTGGQGTGRDSTGSSNQSPKGLFPGSTNFFGLGGNQ